MPEESFEWNKSSLKLLYQVTNALNSADSHLQILHKVLFLLRQYCQCPAVSLQLIENDGTMTLQAHEGLSPEQAHQLQHTPIDGHLFSFETEVINEIQLHPAEKLFDDRTSLQICIPVRYKIRTLGVINLYTIDNYEVTEEIAYLFIAVGAHLGEYLKRYQVLKDEKQALVAEERNMLANELHDSLAQTLASLRFKVRLLDQSLQPVGDFMSIKHIEEVEHGLDAATKDLRDLIAHCRIPIEEQGLIPAIKHLVQTFKEQTGIHILLQCEINNLELPTNIELNAYRIVQEALTNIRKHANAYIVRVLLSRDKDETISILIENDGKGFDPDNIHSHDGKHIGLSIMRERAEHMGGFLKIESDEDEGTRVELTFKEPLINSE